LCGVLARDKAEGRRASPGRPYGTAIWLS